MRRTAFPLFALLFAGLAFAPGLNGPFIHDDGANLSLVMQQVSSWPEALEVTLNNGSGALRRPVSNASFLANYMLAGESAFAFKLINLGLHLACGWLVFCLMQRLAPVLAPAAGESHRNALSLAIALAWVAHPLQVSTVLYVVQRMTILASLFTLAALVLASNYFFEPARARGKTLLMTSGYLAIVALAVLSKESGALTPAFVAVIALTAISVSGIAALDHKRWFLWICCIIPLAIGLIGLILGWEHIQNGYQGRGFNMAERTATEAVILWRYLANIVIPLPGWMHFFRDETTPLAWSDPLVWISVAGWGAAAALAIATRRRQPVLLFGLLWYLAGHAMESTILPLELAYEHRNYLPSLGPIVILCVLIHSLLTRTGAAARPITLAMIGMLMILTASRAFTWSSLPRLVAHETRVNPNSIRANFNAINVAMARQDWPGANARLERIRRLSGGEAWVEMIPLTMACLGGPRLASPQETGRVLVRHATDIRISRGIPQLVSLEMQTHCLTTQSFHLETVLLDMARQARSTHDPIRAADYFYQSAWLSFARGDLQKASDGLEQAVATAPGQDAPLERLFTVQVMQRDRNGAAQTLTELESLWKTRYPLKQYKLDKLKRELQSLD